MFGDDYTNYACRSEASEAPASAGRLNDPAWALRETRCIACKPNAPEKPGFRCANWLQRSTTPFKKTCFQHSFDYFIYHQAWQGFEIRRFEPIHAHHSYLYMLFSTLSHKFAFAFFSYHHHTPQTVRQWKITLRENLHLLAIRPLKKACSNCNQNLSTVKPINTSIPTSIPTGC